MDEDLPRPRIQRTVRLRGLTIVHLASEEVHHLDRLQFVRQAWWKQHLQVNPDQLVDQLPRGFRARFPSTNDSGNVKWVYQPKAWEKAFIQSQSILLLCELFKAELGQLTTEEAVENERELFLQLHNSVVGDSICIPGRTI